MYALLTVLLLGQYQTAETITVTVPVYTVTTYTAPAYIAPAYTGAAYTGAAYQLQPMPILFVSPYILSGPTPLDIGPHRVRYRYRGRW